MVRPGALRYLIPVAILFLILSCGGGQEESDTLRLRVELPADWESLLDMEVLGASVQTPYIGTIRILVENSGDTETWEFAWEDRSGSVAGVELKGDSTLKVEAVTAGTVIMERELSAVGTGDVTVTLRESGGFSAAGSLLHYRQEHSAVAVGDTVLVVGGNLSTRVIEEIIPDGEGFTASAYGTSLVYARSGQDVLYDPVSDRMFVFKGTSNEEEDIFYDLVDNSNKTSILFSISSFRKRFFPVFYNRNVFLFNGYNQNNEWFINTLVLNIDSLSENFEPILGISEEIENPSCLSKDLYFICAGGSLGASYYDDIWRFDLDLRLNLPTTALNSPKENFSINSLGNNKVLITGGIGMTGYMSEVEIIDFETGFSTIFGNGLKRPRTQHISTKLDDDHVIIIGGLEPSQISRTAEILDLTTGESKELPWRMRVSRVGHTATLLPDGRVLVVGGNMGEKTIEVWNPPGEF